MAPEWEGPMEALERNLSKAGGRKIERAKIDQSVSAFPSAGSCQLCGSKDTHKRGLCKPCWRLEVQRQNRA